MIKEYKNLDRMKLSKKLFTLITALGIIAFLTSGCGNNDAGKLVSVSFVDKSGDKPVEYNTQIDLNKLDVSEVKFNIPDTSLKNKLVPEEQSALNVVINAIDGTFDSNYVCGCNNESESSNMEIYFASINGLESKNDYYEYSNAGSLLGNSKGIGWMITIDGEYTDAYLNDVIVRDGQDIILTYSPYEYEWVIE